MKIASVKHASWKINVMKNSVFCYDWLNDLLPNMLPKALAFFSKCTPEKRSYTRKIGLIMSGSSTEQSRSIGSFHFNRFETKTIYMHDRNGCTSNWIYHHYARNVHFVTLANLIFLSQITCCVTFVFAVKLRSFVNSLRDI